MAGPVVNDPTIQASSSLDYVIDDLSGTLRGWKKKVFLKKTKLPKKKDVSYISPNGEEIKSSRQLVKYLKAHPGSLKVGDFCWTSVETPRRSSRLNQKLGRHICFEELELLPTKRRKRKMDCNIRNGTLNPSKGPKSRRSSKLNDNPMIFVKEEPTVELKMLKTLEAPLNKSQEELTTETNTFFKNNNHLQLYKEKLIEEKGVLQKMPLDTQNVEALGVKEVIVLPTYTTLSIVHVLKDTHETTQEIENSNILIKEVESNDKLTFKIEETQIHSGYTKDETIVVAKKSHFVTNIIANKMDVEENPSLKEDEIDKVEDVDISLVNTTIASNMPILVEESEVEIEAEVPKVDNEGNIHKDDTILTEEIVKEEVQDFTIEEPLEEEIVEEQKMDVGHNTSIVQCINEDFRDTKVIELPQLQGIHALVDETIMSGNKVKS